MSVVQRTMGALSGCLDISAWSKNKNVDLKCFKISFCKQKYITLINSGNPSIIGEFDDFSCNRVNVFMHANSSIFGGYYHSYFSNGVGYTCYFCLVYMVFI